MVVSFSIDERIVERARARAVGLGKSLDQLVGDYLQEFASGNDPEQWIDEFRRLSGRGGSDGWQFDRDEIHKRS